MSSQAPVDPYRFNPQDDLLIEFIPPTQAMSEALQEMYRKEDWDGIRRSEDTAKLDQKKLAENIEGMEHPNEEGKESAAWIPVDTKDGEDLMISFIKDVGTMWRWTKEETPSASDINTQAVVRFGTHSANSSSTSILGLRFFTWKSIPLAVFKVLISLLAAKFFVKAMAKPLAQAIRWLAEEAGSIMSKKTTGQLTGRIFVKSIKKVRGLAAGALGPLGVIGAVVGIDYFTGYILKEYALRVIIINFDTQHTWKPTSAGGNNQTLGEGVEWEGYQIPPLQLPGGNFSPEGFTKDMIAKNVKLAHYGEYIYHNKDAVLGGFTVTGACGRLNKGGSVTEGFNFAYRVEKAAENSMRLEAGTTEAQQYYKDTRGKLTKTQALKIHSPGDVVAHSPVIWNAKDNRYEMRIVIGKPPLAEKQS